MRQKGFAHLFLIIGVVLVAMGAIGYLAYQNAQLSKEANNTVPTAAKSTPLPTSNVTQESKENETWNTYTHPKYNYSFDYPSDWQVEMAGYSTLEPNGFPYVSKQDGSYQSITFNYDKETETNKMSLSGSKKMTINNLDAYKFEGIFGGDSVLNSYVFKISNDEYITARYPTEDPNIPIEKGSDDVVTAEKIVKTFKMAP